MNEITITEKSNDLVLFLSFLIGIPLTFLFAIYEVPFLYSIDENLGWFLGMISVGILLFVPPKIAEYIIYGKTTQQKNQKVNP